MSRARLAPLALLLALLLPGLGGSWLSLGHPCPAAAAVAGSPEGGHDVGAHGHHDGAHDPEAPSQHGAHCECLGACQGGAVPLAPSATELAVAAHINAHVAPASGWTTWFPQHTPLDLLPLPTAPPVA